MGANWVVFDYGGVISQHTDAMGALSSRLGVRGDEFERAYWAHRDAYDRGSADLSYWRSVATQCGVTLDAGASAELTELDTAGWLHAEQDTVRLLAELADAGARLALLSNAPSSIGRAVVRQHWARHFEHLLFSGDLGLAKPDPQVWVALTGALGARPAHCLFVDVKQENVDSARDAGLHAQLWSGAAGLRGELLDFATGR